MSERQLTKRELKRFTSLYLKEVWLLIENPNGGDGNGPRFEVLCCDPKLAKREGHKISPDNWLYIQPDGERSPRLVRVNNLSKFRHVMERYRKSFERDRSTWNTDKEPPTNTNKTICNASKNSIRAAKRELRKRAKRQELKSNRKAATNEFVLARRKRSDRTRQFDGAVPSGSGVLRSRQLVTPSPPHPPSTPEQNSSATVESSYSSDNQSVTSSSTEEEERFKRLVKSIARYTGHVGKRSEKSRHSSHRSSQRSYEHHRRRLLMSTPIPRCSHDTAKLTFDVGTQTDPPMEVEEAQQEEEEEEEDMEEEEGDDQDGEEQDEDEQEMEEQDDEEQEIEKQIDGELEDGEQEDEEEDEEKDSEVIEGRAALIKMGSLIQNITSQFNLLTQSIGLEGMCLTMSDLEGDTSESESDSDSETNAESNQSDENASSPPEPQEEVEESPPEPVRRVSPPVQADASPSVPRVPTPQQPVVGSVEQADGGQQSSNESGEHFVTTSNIMGPGPSKQRMVKVRRVSAHTTNKIERAPGEELVPIGNGRAMVPARLLEEIDWNSYTQATRQLLQAVFPRRVLATHSLTGKPSPAFLDKPPKKRLNPQFVEDVVIVVTLRCGVTERLVRNCITIKCTDEAKLYRNRQQCRQGRLQGSDQENVPPNQTTDETTETSSGEI